MQKQPRRLAQRQPPPHKTQWDVEPAAPLHLNPTHRPTKTVSVSPTKMSSHSSTNTSTTNATNFTHQATNPCSTMSFKHKTSRNSNSGPKVSGKIPSRIVTKWSSSPYTSPNYKHAPAFPTYRHVDVPLTNNTAANSTFLPPEHFA